MGQLTDTTSDAQRVLTECYRRMPPARKWAILGDAYRTARALHEVGFRRRHPDTEPAAVQAEWRRLALGRLWQPQFPEIRAVEPQALESLPIVRHVMAVFRRLQLP